MIETSTPQTNSVNNETNLGMEQDTLSEEERCFYESLKPKLDLLKAQPQQKTIDAILKHSVSK